MRSTITAVFRDPEAALRAAEQLRVDERAGSVRLFLPGEEGAAVETLLVHERSPWLRVSVWGIAVGIAFAWLAHTLSSSWLYATVALAAGVVFGLVLAGSLGGPRHPRPLRPHMRERYLELVKRGRAVVLVDIPGAPEPVRTMMEESGAYVSEGYWPVRDELQPV